MEGEDTATADAEKRAQRRVRLVKKATKSWTGQLVDLTGRNNLLYFKDLKVGTLALDQAPEDLLFDLMGGKSVNLRQLFKAEEAHDDAVKRARTVRNKANVHYEERGLATLYLACGIASWSGHKSASQPAAPILLVPVQMAPKGAAQEEFSLTVTDEPEVNPTFLQMLKAEFDIDCDAEELLESSGIEGAIDTSEELVVTYDWLRKKCASVPDFAIEDRFVVGNFSYAKLPMVKDLEQALDALVAHDLIAALAGDPEAQEALREKGATNEIPGPDFTPPSDEFLVLDADSSQNSAINAVLAGQNLIVKGPPGTGKSQTIANLVSTLVARGKRVLFVAEKRAAIDAVLRRLTDVGLDDLVLDLHGGVSSRRDTARALARALDTNARIAQPDVRSVHRQLAQRRDQLVQRTEAVHETREPWDISFFEVQSQLAALPSAANTELRFRDEALRKLSSSALVKAQEDLDEYIGRGGTSLAYSGSPWARAIVVSSEEAQAVQRETEACRTGVESVLARLRTAAKETGLTDPGTISGWSRRVSDWECAQRVLAIFDATVYEADLEEILTDGAPLAGSASARLSSAITSARYRAARRALRATVTDGVSPAPAELFEQATEARRLLELWNAESVNDSGVPRPCSEVGALRTAFDDLADRLTELAATLGLQSSPDDTDELEALIAALLGDIGTLAKLPELHRLRTSLQRAGLDELLEELKPLDVPGRDAIDRLRFAWLTSLHDELQLVDPRIGAFDGEQHAKAVIEFQEADREHIATTSQRVRRLCAEQAVATQDRNPEGSDLIKDQAARKRKHLPIRQVFEAAPEVTLALKPCWAMSPLVVSQVLPSHEPYFDVVVFDEASQIRPAEAIPAIARGKQLVVAGDDRQLPPTDFFSSLNPEVEVEDDEDEGGYIAVDSGFESVLDAMVPFIKSRMLQWHYRSRDERLIAFSNVHLYDRALTTFPGIVGPECIRHIEVPFEPSPDSSASAGAEVRKVVELIIEHAEKRPDQSLGVIAMGIKHANRIDEALRETLSDRDDLEAFFDEKRHEPFFIKNLERVQGDERDAIVLSVGYGKNDDGRLLYRFGPLNQTGGERRLNVAVTRSKESMTLVSSFSHHDMDPERSSAQGVQLLRLYLEYCACNGASLGDVAASIPELNPFEIDVRDALVRAGIPLIPQYGSSGYRIDFAAKHPDKPGRMVLAIECDGATYHSAPTARDRDRLRQEHLERLGWTFHRIWSQDWFQHRDREITRAKESYDDAVKRSDTASADSSAGRPAEAASREPDRPASLVEKLKVDTSNGSDARMPRQKQAIDGYSRSELAGLISSIEADGLLRTKSELTDEAIRRLGYRRRGHRIIAAVEQAIDDSRADRP